MISHSQLRRLRSGFGSRWLMMLLTLLVLPASYGADLSREACNAISRQVVGDVRIVETEWVAPDAAVGQPLCLISGHRAPYLDIEVALPSEWSGRYLQQGGGGFDGFIRSAVERDDNHNVVVLMRW